jgi:hypothetical protein
MYSLITLSQIVDAVPPPAISPPYEEQPEGYYAITWYFVDPTTICTSQKKPEVADAVRSIWNVSD